jgi:hypothetical protein
LGCRHHQLTINVAVEPVDLRLRDRVRSILGSPRPSAIRCVSIVTQAFGATSSSVSIVSWLDGSRRGFQRFGMLQTLSTNFAPDLVDDRLASLELSSFVAPVLFEVLVTIPEQITDHPFDCLVRPFAVSEFEQGL